MRQPATGEGKWWDSGREGCCDRRQKGNLIGGRERGATWEKKEGLLCPLYNISAANRDVYGISKKSRTFGICNVHC